MSNRDREIGAKSRIELVDMEFFAHHGHFSEEKIIGNRFIVNFSIDTDISIAGISDNLEETINYQEVYNLIREEMELPSNLLEHVATRILNRFRKSYPNALGAEISIEKINPPLGGKVAASKVVLSY